MCKLCWLTFNAFLWLFMTWMFDGLQLGRVSEKFFGQWEHIRLIQVIHWLGHVELTPDFEWIMMRIRFTSSDGLQDAFGWRWHRCAGQWWRCRRLEPFWWWWWTHRELIWNVKLFMLRLRWNLWILTKFLCFKNLHFSDKKIYLLPCQTETQVKADVWKNKHFTKVVWLSWNREKMWSSGKLTGKLSGSNATDD